MFKAGEKSRSDHTGENILLRMGSNGVKSQENTQFKPIITEYPPQSFCKTQKKAEKVLQKSEERRCEKRKESKEPKEKFKRERYREEITEHKQGEKEMWWSLTTRESSHDCIITDAGVITCTTRPRTGSGVMGNLLKYAGADCIENQKEGYYADKEQDQA